MKKGLSLLISATALLGLSQLASAAATSTSPDGKTQTVNGQASNYSDDTADIIVNGTLGVDNTDPTAPINPEVPVDPNNPTGPQKPNPEWINVTVPTKTIFYNAIDNPEIKSPYYQIKNNSGRPVTVSVNKFTHTSSDTLPTDFDLNLELTSTGTVTSAKTPLIVKSALQTTFNNPLVTLANNEGKQTQSATAVTDSNLASFSYGGEATVKAAQKTDYTLNLKFVPVTTEFEK